jgi:hypothetical protein
MAFSVFVPGVEVDSIRLKSAKAIRAEARVAQPRQHSIGIEPHFQNLKSAWSASRALSVTATIQRIQASVSCR